VLCQITFKSVFHADFLHSYTAQFNLECMGTFTYQTGDLVNHRTIMDALVRGGHCPARNGTSGVCHWLLYTLVIMKCNSQIQ